MPGKERDNESGLDNFGARYDSSALGRFMTPDWAARATGVPYAVYGDPQSLNLYGYVENSPINRADADGHVAPSMCGSGGQACKNEQVSAAINKFANSRAGQAAKGVIGVTGAIIAAPELAGAGAAATTIPEILGVTGSTLATTGTFVNGTMDIVGAATNTDTEKSDNVVSDVTNPVAGATALATQSATAGSDAGDIATVAGAIHDVASGKDIKNPAEVAGSVGGAIDAVKSAGAFVMSAIKGSLVQAPPPPSPPPPPKACNTVCSPN